jgi:conjugative relaxase-like TrwC/TraI family protein
MVRLEEGDGPMTVSIGRINIDYYLESAAAGDGAHTGPRDLTAYYTEASAPAGRWWGTGLEGAHLTEGEAVTKWAAKRLYEDFVDPTTGETLGRRPIEAAAAPAGAKTPVGAPAKANREAVAGFDLTFSVPKSVSVLWALADPNLQGTLYEAHRKAMTECMEWLEREVIQARAGHAGVAKTPVRGVIASMFDHWDSRAGDPQLHTHVVVANRVQRVSDGAWVTVDSFALHRHVVAVSEMYNSLLYDRIAAMTTAAAELRAGTAAETDPELVRALNAIGGGGEDPRSARAELVGVPDALLAEFSSRSIEIEARTDELVAAWEERTGRKAPAAVLLELRQEATLTTRRPKETSGALSLPEKMSAWRLRAVNAGFSPAKVIADATGHHSRPVRTADIPARLVDLFASYALRDASGRRTTFNRANLTASTERLLRGVRMGSASDREILVSRVVDAAVGHAVGLTPDRMGAPVGEDPYLVNRGSSVFDSPGTAAYTTKETIEAEEYLISRTREKGSAVTATAVGEGLDRSRTSGGHRLGADQSRAAGTVLSNGRALDAIVGPAGTGKTTTMRAVRELWEDTYGLGSVVGLAPSAVAAAVLGEEIGATTENVAKWLYESAGEGAVRRLHRVAELEERIRDAQVRANSATPRGRALAAADISHAAAVLASLYAERAKFRLREGQLLIIDEASMVGTAALAELARQAEAAGAKVLLVGDPSQLEAVEAGGFMGWMERNADVSVLDTVWRFAAEWEAEASLRLRSGNPSALEAYDAAGRIHAHVAGEAVDAAYRAWVEDAAEDPARSLLIAAKNETVDELNCRAQIDLAKAGRVDLSSTAELRTGVAGLGDLVLARKNNRMLRDAEGHFVKNGTRLKVTEIRADGAITARRTDTGAVIVLPAEYVSESVELAYAVTAHRAQGVTVETAHTVTGPGESRELFYVAMTRGTRGNYCYVDVPDTGEQDSPDTWGIMRPVQPEEAMEVLQGVLRNERAERTAHEVYGDEHGWAEDLARLLAELEYVAHAANATRTVQWLASSAPERLEAFQLDPGWIRLVAADPASTALPAADPRTMSPSEVAALCADQPDSTDFVPATAEQERVKGILSKKIAARLRHAEATVRQGRPVWFDEWEESAGEVSSTALHDVLAWRAVSSQEDAQSALGKGPSKTDRRLHPRYSRAQAALRKAQPDAWADHPVTPEDDLLLSQLTESKPVPVAAGPHAADGLNPWGDLDVDPGSPGMH